MKILFYVAIIVFVIYMQTRHNKKIAVKQKNDLIKHETKIIYDSNNEEDSAFKCKYIWTAHPAGCYYKHHNIPKEKGGLNGFIYDYKNPPFDFLANRKIRPEELGGCNCYALARYNEIPTDSDSILKKEVVDFSQEILFHDDFHIRHERYSPDFIREKVNALAKGKMPEGSLVIPSEFMGHENWELTLKFKESKSSVFDTVIDFCKKYSAKFTQNEKDFEVLFTADRLPEFKRIYDMCKTWKSTLVYIYGSLIDKRDLADILRCCVDRANAINNKTFCYGISSWTDNPFGCHRVSIKNGAYPWYSFLGKREDEYIEIDKNKMLSTLAKDLRRYRFCPYMNIRKIWENFVAIPTRIYFDNPDFVIWENEEGNVEIDTRWTFQYGEYVSWGDLKKEFGDRLLSRKPKK